MEVIQHLLVRAFDFAGRSHCPNEAGNRVDDQLQALLIRTEGILGAFPVVNVSQQHVPTGDMTFRVSQWEGARLEPAIYAIGTPLTEFKNVRLPGFDRALPRIDHARKVFRMDSVASAPILQFLSRLAEIFQNLPVEEFDLACRTQGTN